MIDYNELSSSIIGASIEVHKILGPGLLEKIYERALAHELTLRGYKVQSQVQVPIIFKGIDLALDDDKPLKLDLIVEDSVIVELKSVEEMKPVYSKQLLTYLKLMDKKLGLLINFNVPRLTDGVERIVNKL